MKPNLNREELAIIKEVNYKGTAETAIRECNSCGPTLFKRNTQTKWVCIPCYKNTVTRSRQKRKAKIISDRGGKCEGCGYDDVRALQWHHTVPLKGDRKEYNRLQNKSYKGMKEHTDKHCELLCANCHLIRHSEEELGGAKSKQPSQLPQ